MVMVRNFEVISDRFNTVGIMRINGSMDFVLIHLQAYFFPQRAIEVFQGE
jgi:hypothetical protein